MQIPENVLAVLSRCSIQGTLLTLPEGQLDRKLYVAVNKVLEGLGGKWDRKAKAHVFDHEPSNDLDRAILTGEITGAADLGWFPTPPALAAEVINRAKIKPGMRVLEPSAGEGALAFRASDIAGPVDCFEIDPARAAKLAVLPRTIVVTGDFLTFPPEALYDRVVMNPPFARQADIAHVQHAWKFLKPGGRLVAIVSAGAYFREDRKACEFRAWMLRATVIGFKWIENPPGAFKESGTNVRTYILVLDKLKES